MPTSKLSTFIVPPKRVAQILDWKSIVGRCIMSLDISDDRIGVAHCQHPSTDATVCSVEPITYMSRGGGARPLKRVDQNERVVKELERLVRKHVVCGFVVAWPLLPDGRMGKQCGKVLHLLDIFAGGKTPLISRNRPFTLWDERDLPPNNLEMAIKNDRDTQHTDNWGRNQIFSRIPSMALKKYSSKDGYCHEFTDDSTGAVLTLKSYMGAHFEIPESSADDDEFECLNDLHNFNHEIDCRSSIVDYDDYANEGAYLQPKLL